MTLRAVREAAGVTQGELAALLGVSRCTVNRIESGRQVPRRKLQMMIEVWMERQCHASPR